MTSFVRRLRFRRDHRWAPRRMSEYLDGELAARGRERLEHHTSRCPKCRQVLQTLRLMVKELPSLRGPARPGAAEAILASVRERLAHEHPAPARDRPA